MTDALNPTEIAAEQRETEKQLQPLPLAQLEADEAVTNALYDLNLAKARFARSIAGEKMTAVERELMIFEATAEEWKAWQNAKSGADYLKARGKVLSETLISLMSRNKTAMKVDEAHGRFGDG